MFVVPAAYLVLRSRQLTVPNVTTQVTT
jgi:hypothetical protein